MNEEQEKLIGREFRHFKGNLYRLEGFAKDSETLDQITICFDTCQHVYRLMGETVAKAFSCGKELM